MYIVGLNTQASRYVFISINNVFTVRIYKLHHNTTGTETDLFPKMNPVHVLTNYLLETHVDIILLFRYYIYETVDSLKVWQLKF
jgi:hypothetical protein